MKNWSKLLLPLLFLVSAQNALSQERATKDQAVAMVAKGIAALKAKGIDEVACTAVNDAFVMKAWGAASGSADVTMLADGNGDLATALGLTMDGSGFGLGTRGQRFSMVVNDGVVEQLFVEAPGDFKVSTAEHMLESL